MTIDADNQSRRLERLLQLTGQRDQSAFEQLYVRISPKLLGVLISILKSRALAEEALQEVFMRIWRKASTFDAERGNAIVWMTSVARYHALDLLRRQRLREQQESGLNDIDLDVVGYTNFKPVDTQLADNELLNTCLYRLSDQRRYCIVRAYCEGASHEELSQELSTPLGTVKSWIRRSLASLKECIRELQ